MLSNSVLKNILLLVAISVIRSKTKQLTAAKLNATIIPHLLEINS